MKTVMESIAAGFLVTLLSACSGPQHVHPDCVEDYDNCINACAYQCDQGELTVGPSYSDDSETVNTWDFECQRCTDQCAEIARRCSDRARDSALSD